MVGRTGIAGEHEVWWERLQAIALNTTLVAVASSGINWYGIWPEMGLTQIWESNNTGDILSKKRPLTPGYIIFYILFLPDTWQALMGLLAAYFLTPLILSPEMGVPAQILLYVMIATIGYAATRGPARWLTHKIKKWILGDRLSS